MKPFAESCEINKFPILEVLKDVFRDRKHVLEIASGTGQHAVYFAGKLPHLIWQTSELAEKHDGIKAWLAEAQLTNILPPLTIDVNDSSWPVAPVDAIFNANTVHIISRPEINSMFANIARAIAPGGCVCFYGPYNYNGKFTSDSNAKFDQWLKSRNPKSGVRDFEEINLIAKSFGLNLVSDIEMPINNRTLVWHASS